MSLSHTEDLLNALESHIESNLAARLTAISTDIDDAIPLPVLTDVVVGVTDLAGYASWPLGVIIPVRDQYEALSMGADELTAEVDLWVIAANYADATLYRQVLRYGAALRNLIEDDPSLGDAVGDCRVQELEYFPRLAGVDGARAVRLRVTLIAEV